MIQVKEKVTHIVTELKPNLEIKDDTELFLSEILDSFDLLLIVSEIEDHFKIDVPGEEILPENFESITAISTFINKYLES